MAGGASFTVRMSALAAVTGCLKTCLIHWDRLSEAERLDLVRRARRSAARAVSTDAASEAALERLAG